MGDGSAGVPFETEKLRELFRMIAPGLLWHHTRLRLPETHDAIAFTLPDDVLEELAHRFLAMRGIRIEGDIAEGTFGTSGWSVARSKPFNLVFSANERVALDRRSRSARRNCQLCHRSKRAPTRPAQTVRTRWLKEAA